MSPRSHTQFEEIREEKKTLIMNVALERFANDGYFRTTINHIARHAGISKGLMYNYFESKEALLKAILQKSLDEVYNYLDINKDGYLSEEEFEFFIRKLNIILKSKKYFWRLLFQLLMQEDVKKQFLKSITSSDSDKYRDHEKYDKSYHLVIMKILNDYFLRKKERMGEEYDPQNEVNMFINTLAGFAITNMFGDGDDTDKNEKLLNRIIELYK